MFIKYAEGIQGRTSGRVDVAPKPNDREPPQFVTTAKMPALLFPCGGYRVPHQMHGGTLGKVGAAAIRGLFTGMKSLIASIGKAPDWVKVVLLLVALYCIFNPEAREKILRLARAAFAGIAEGGAALVSHISEAAALAEQQKQVSLAHLESANSKMNSK
jgi:hypothetical protein